MCKCGLTNKYRSKQGGLNPAGRKAQPISSMSNSIIEVNNLSKKTKVKVKVKAKVKVKVKVKAKVKQSFTILKASGKLRPLLNLNLNLKS